MSYMDDLAYLNLLDGLRADLAYERRERQFQEDPSFSDGYIQALQYTISRIEQANRG